MGQKIEIPAELLEFGGLKVSMQNSLSYSIDTVGTRGNVVTGTLYNATTVTSNGTQSMSNVSGGSFMIVRWNVTDVTISSGSLFFLIQKRLPDTTTWQTMLSRPITTTEHFMAQISAQPDATSDLIAVTSFPATNTVLNGPWDLARVQLFGDGIYSVTLTADYIVY